MVWGAIAREVPDRLAIVCGDRSVTWHEFDDRAARLVRRFDLGKDTQYLYEVPPGAAP